MLLLSKARIFHNIQYKLLLKQKGEFAMDKYVCPCGYVYDPELGDPDNGVAPGTPWENVPEDWVCPVCSLGKEMFEKE